jgi:hypothetical protein
VVFGLQPQAVRIGGGALGPAAEANPFFAAAPPPLAFVAWSVMWVAGFLALAVWSLERREL